jgi:hypothetical protein
MENQSSAFDAPTSENVTLENEPSVNILAAVKEATAFIRAHLDPA